MKIVAAVVFVLVLAGCRIVPAELVRGCEAIADPVAYANCRLTGLTSPAP